MLGHAPAWSGRAGRVSRGKPSPLCAGEKRAPVVITLTNIPPELNSKQLPITPITKAVLGT